jgi:predicted AlkP superfamily phosphohydrolase/phosphomutase
VAGRYPLGCVAAGADYEAVRHQIQRGLQDLRDGNGTRVFRAVHTRDEIYDGPFVAEAPDVLAVCAEGYGIGSKPLGAELRARAVIGLFDEARYSGHTGVHDPFGIYLFAGPTVSALGAHRMYPIESIAPTVLHLLELPVPRSMDGEVATSLLDPALLARQPVCFTDDADDELVSVGDWDSAEDEALVADRLRSLGYLE